MLLQICDYIRQQSIVSDQQLANVFSIERTALQAILDLCIQHNIIALCSDTAACKSNCSTWCMQRNVQYYRFTKYIL